MADSVPNQDNNKRYWRGYRRTKLKEFFKGRTARKYIILFHKREVTTVTGVRINKNGKPIL